MATPKDSAPKAVEVGRNPRKEGLGLGAALDFD